MTHPAISLRGLTKHYGNIRALDGLDLDIPRGRIFGIIGPNGAGKTTMFSILCGWIRPTSGTVTLDGHLVEPGANLPLLLSTYPQDALMLDGINVKRHLIYYAKLSGFEGAAAEKEASRVLHLVNLPEVWERHHKTLSHGQRKRVGLAQAFIGTPDVIILDEPTAGLDPASARVIRSAIREAAVDRTVLVSSHDLDQVQELCSDVAILDRGKIARIDAMANLTQVGGRVSFKLPEQPSDPQLAELRALDYVQRAEWDLADARLRVEVDLGVQSAEQAAGQLVTFLATNGIKFSDMLVGQRLADVVRDETD